MNNATIAIIGTGDVGATIAYALLLQKINAHILLIDKDAQRCTGEMLDLSDAAPLSNGGSVGCGTFRDAAQADIIIIAAGKRQEVNQPRTALVDANKLIIKSIMEQLIPIKSSTIILMITNPVDIMAHYAYKLSQLPPNQVIGSGTFLDTQRLRAALSQKLNIDEQSIHAYIIGEHGDTQFPAWSCSYIAGVPLLAYKNIEIQALNTIAQDVRDKALRIINYKGSTYYGIATCTSALCRTIFLDQKRVTPVSCYNPDFDLYLSLPIILGKNGVEEVIKLPLNQTEQHALAQSVACIQKFTINS